MKYTVQQGDTLSKIARDVLGNMALWPAIAELNDLKNPDLIFPGQVLILPDKLEPLPVAEALEANRQQAGMPGWLGFLLLLSVGGGLVYANRHKLKSKSKLSGIVTDPNKVKVGDYLLLNTGDEVAKIKVTKPFPDIEGTVIHKGKKHSRVAVLKSDFEKGFVSKISSTKRVKQKLK